MSLNKAKAEAMSFVVYGLECSDGTIYVGITSDLPRRLKEHEAGTASRTTRWRRPVTLVHTATFDNREEAAAWERQLKGWSRLKKTEFFEKWNSSQQAPTSGSRSSP